MGEEDAKTLMQQLPPCGWDSMATRDDLQVLSANFTAALAEFRVEVTSAFAEFRVEVTNALAVAAKERAEIVRSQAELVKSQARNLYITVFTVVLARRLHLDCTARRPDRSLTRRPGLAGEPKGS